MTDLINYGLDYSQHVCIREGTPYTVPEGSYFLATAFASKDWVEARQSQSVQMLVDDVIKYDAMLEWMDSTTIRTPPLNSIVKVPGGCVAGPGTVVKAQSTWFVGSPSDEARILGVLLPEAGGAVPGNSPLHVPFDAWVRIEEGTPYPVPDGKFFVLTGLGIQEVESDITDYDLTLSVGGSAELYAAIHWRNTTSSEARSGERIVPVPSGFTVSGPLVGAQRTLTGQVGTGGGATKTYAPRGVTGPSTPSVSGSTITVATAGTTVAFALGYIKNI